MSKQVINTGTAANDGTGDTLRGAAIKINSNFTELYESAQSAFGKANSGYELANAAYAYANASAVLITQELSSNVDFIAAINSTQNTTITTVTALTTNAYNKANNSGSFANGAFTVANSATTTSGNAYVTANGAFDKANVAYNIANNSLNVQTGGSISGDITLGTNQLKFGSGDVYEYSDSLLLNPHQNKALSIKTSILDGFNELTYGWTFGANGTLIFPDNTLQTTAFTTGISNTIIGTGVYANGAFSKANDAYSLANSAFAYANTLISDTMVDPWARQQANDAFTAANTAPFDQTLNTTDNVQFFSVTTNQVSNTGNVTVITSVGTGNTTFTFTGAGELVFPDGSPQTSAALSLADFKFIVASSTDFADFQTRIAAL